MERSELSYQSEKFSRAGSPRKFQFLGLAELRIGRGGNRPPDAGAPLLREIPVINIQSHQPQLPFLAAVAVPGYVLAAFASFPCKLKPSRLQGLGKNTYLVNVRTQDHHYE